MANADVSKRLTDAAYGRDLSTIQELIAAGIDVNMVHEGRWPPLNAAIENLQLDAARLLITAGADVHRTWGNGFTPLIHAIDAENDAAVQSGKEMSADLVELLLAAGAIPTE